MNINGMNQLLEYWKAIGDEHSSCNIERLQTQQFIPFIGAGMSIPFGYPDWSNFLFSVIDEYFEPDENDRVEFEGLLTKKKYLDLADRLNNSLNNGIAEEVRKVFNETHMKSIPQNQNYLELLRLAGITTFVTTNFDCVIEKNLKIDSENIYLPSNMLNANDIIDAIRRKKTSVIKLHGTYNRADSIILTKSEFDSSYCARNTALTQIVDFLWNSSVFLFLGCGLSKDYLVNRMSQLAGNQEQNWHYAILAYPQGNIKQVKRELTKLKICPIWFEPNHFEYIQIIMKMILQISDPETKVDSNSNETKQDPNLSFQDTLPIQQKAHHSINEQLKYLDHLAEQVKDNLRLQNKLVKAIFTQNDNYEKVYFKQNDIINCLLERILSSTANYPLSFVGEPGTGKSTILSLLFYRCIQLHQNIRCLLVDTHYYDKSMRDESRDDLIQYLEKFDKSLLPQEKAIIFLDGINRFIRGDGSLEEIIAQWVKSWKNNPNIKFVLAIGDLNERMFPPFRHSGIKSPLLDTSDYIISFHPVNNESPTQPQLVDATMRFFFTLNNIKCKKDNSYIKDKLCHYCKKIGVKSIDFRTIYFAIKELNKAPSPEKFFETDIGTIYNSYFHLINDEVTMLSTARYTALRLLQKKPKRPKNFYYLYKSESIRNFFFAYYYINILKSSNIQDLMLFDCIFTPGINRFAVDLMVNQPDFGESIVENIGELMGRADITLSQKNQMAFLLGRVTRPVCKSIAIEILSREYDTWDWGKRMTTSEAMYVRTVGISLTYLDSLIHSNDFYEKLIYNGYLSKINRNFHVQYFLIDSYCFAKELKLDDNEICSAENIDKLYQYLYHSIFEKNPRRESVYINVITILNLTVFRIFYLGENSDNDISKAQKLIDALLSSSNALSNNIILKYIKNIEDFINNGNIYASTLINIYNLKDIQRTGWIERGVNLKRNTESVADHTWACCQLALLFLPEHFEDCKFADPSELLFMKDKYNLSKVIQMLIIHDLGEAYTGDIVSDKKNEIDEKRECDIIRNLVTLDTLPHFGTLGFIDNLKKEFGAANTYNAKLARDIDLIEPLIQLFIYRKELSTYHQDKGIQERDNWINDVRARLNTAFGKNLLKFLYDQVLCHF